MDSHPGGVVSMLKSLFQHDDSDDEPPHGGQEAVKILENVEKFFNTNVNEVMVPRTEMVTLEEGLTLKEALDAINSSGFSRIPVQKNRKDDIVGILYAKDLILHIDSLETKLIGDIMRDPYFVSYSQSIQHLLHNFQKTHVHLGIVIDEYGGVDGIVTIEDIIEELIGEIDDEFDKNDIKPSYEVVNQDESFIDAHFLLDDFNELYEKKFEKEGIETIGGYICYKLDRIPKEKEICEVEGIQFEIIEREERKLIKLKVNQSAKTNNT